MDDFSEIETTDLMKAIGNVFNLKIMLLLLIHKEMNKSKLSRRLDLSYSTIAKSLKELEEVGLVKTSEEQPQGRQKEVVARLTSKGKEASEILKNLLNKHGKNDKKMRDDKNGKE